MVNIRKADKEDIYALIILWNELIMYHQNKMNNLPISKEWTDLKTKELEWIIESKRNIIYLVELGTNIIGYIRGSIRKIPPLYDIRNEGNIDEIYVIPKYRKKGFATKLVNTLIEEFKNRKVDFINLHVDIDNEIGQRFWDMLGFDIVSIHRRYQIGGK